MMFLNVLRIIVVYIEIFINIFMDIQMFTPFTHEQPGKIKRIDQFHCIRLCQSVIFAKAILYSNIM